VACATAGPAVSAYGHRVLPRLLALPPALALAAALLVAPPAHADLVGTTSAEDVVLKNRCIQHPIDYSFAVGAGTLLWQTTVRLVSPSGRTSEGIPISSDLASPTSGTVTVLVCGSAAPGTWTVRTTGSYQVLPLVNIPISVADSTFQVRRTATRTKLAGTHLRGDRYRVVAAVKERRKGGFRPTESAEVTFQRKVGGSWRTIKGSRTLTTKGIAATVVTVARGTKVRAVTAHAGYLGGSTSRAVRLHR
jgi:hypothetical protein